MTTTLINLSTEEKKLLYRTPALVAVLIAGSDDNIDNKELEAAKMIANFKKVTSREILEGYYDVVREEFQEDMKHLIDQYPNNSEERQQFIIGELSKLNNILPKIDQKFAIQFLASMKDFARKIAESSGGFLGFLPMGYEESRLIGLEMIKKPA